MIRRKITHDGTKNASVQFTGYGPFDAEVVLRLGDMTPPPKDFRIDAVYFAVGAGMEVQVAWEGADGPHPFLPLGGRGKIDFSEVGGVHNDVENRTGNLMLSTSDSGLFIIVLDLSKHHGV